MPALLFGKGAYKRDYGNLPEIRCVNMFAEETPTAKGGVSLQSRKGLTTHVTRGIGPINGIYSRGGVFDGALFSVSNTVLYKDATVIGAITGSADVRWSASDTELVLGRGGFAYSYIGGTDLAAIVFPDTQNVIAHDYLASYFIFIVEGSHQFYWSALLDARDVDGLNFASAELLPDNLLDLKVLAGTLYLFGEESIEGWVPSGNADLPFTRIDQRLFLTGIKATGCVQEVADSLVFIGHDNVVYTITQSLQPISNHGIEERIAGSDTVSTFTFEHEGHKFFCIRLDEETMVWDARSGEWCEFATFGRDNFRAKCATNQGDTPYLGDDETNDIWKFQNVFEDDGNPLEGYFRALLPIEGGAVSVDNIYLDCNTGQTNTLAGDDANPTIEMRYSRDGGNTFSDWRTSTLGAQGAYTARATWRRCGMFRQPGAVFEFRPTDRSPRRFSGVYYNEAGGGRN